MSESKRNRKRKQSETQNENVKKQKLNDERREYYSQNKQKINNRRRENYTKNKDRINEKRRKYYSRNKNKINQQRRYCHFLNPEKINKQKRRHYSHNKIKKINKVLHYQRHMYDPYYQAAIEGSRNCIDPSVFLLGDLNNECEFCKAVHFAKENKQNCCQKGKVFVPYQEDYPIELKHLLTDNNAHSKRFRENIIQYNEANAFASMETASQFNAEIGPCTLKILGKLNHRTYKNLHMNPSCNSTSLHANSPPSYSQLYVYNTKVSLRIRMKNASNKNCTLQNMKTLNLVLNSVSPYAKIYRIFRELNESLKNIVLVFLKRSQADQAICNAIYTSHDMAIVYVNEYVPTCRDFTVHFDGQRNLFEINNLSQHLDPMIFPVFFPRGDHGWTPDIPHQSQYSVGSHKRVTILQFYSHKIAIRRNHFNPLFYGGKLFQQYLIYAYCRYESNQMNFFRNNQQDLRIELYKGLLDNSKHSELDESKEFSSIFILPSSFVGSPRFLLKLYHDNMALIRKFGIPDLFITFTCNPQWPEIVSELKPFQTFHDRPDMVIRVFQLKFKEFLHDMIKKRVFGKLKAYCYVIEFQKCGLPHAHCLFTLSEEDKIRTSDQVDGIIKAELPDEKANPELYKIIMSYNIHEPCNNVHSKSLCKIDGRCSKGFPKIFQEHTDAFQEGYPMYKRCNNVNLVHDVRNGVDIDNSWVIPYNPFLSLKYKSHINVEIVSTVRVVKYIHKFLWKSLVYTELPVIDESKSKKTDTSLKYDEISRYLNSRYVNAMEASWRLQKFRIHGQSHSVLQLAVHLKNSQPFYIKEKGVERQLRCNAVINTTLTAYFDLNNHDTFAHQYLYQDITVHYVYKNNRWERRSQKSHFGSKMIGRLVSISSKNSELYHLRLLLLSVKGVEATSFEKLKEHNGIVYRTYREAAVSRGLVNDIYEFQKCMQKASAYLPPNLLRSLFVTIISSYSQSNSEQLFKTFEHNMVQDYVEQGYSQLDSLNLCLLDINEQLEKNGQSLHDLLPSLSGQVRWSDRTLSRNSESEQLCNGSLNEVLLWNQLNKDQLRIAERIYESASGLSERKCFYIDGPGGSGKTFLYRALIQRLESSGHKILSVAWTGIAANLLPGGRTAHSAFGLPLDFCILDFPKLPKFKKDFLKSIDLIIWDEASMIQKIALEYVDKILQDIMGNEFPFGGKVLVLGGDFRQVLPVLQNGTREDLINTTIKKSFLWNQFQPFYLKKNMRVVSDCDFSEWLLKVGDGEMRPPLQKMTEHSIQIPYAFMSDNIVFDVFSKYFKSPNTPELYKTVILCPKNKDVHAINEEVLKHFDHQEERIFLSIDSVLENEENNLDYSGEIISTEFLNSLNPSGLPPHSLKLKTGCIVILLRNILISKGLCNGTRMVVKNFYQDILEVELISGSFTGSTEFIPRITFDTSNDSVFPFVMVRHQFPVQLAYAMTINKAQGQTFDKVGLYLPEPCFTHGQLYTAFSRVTDSKFLKIQIINTKSQGKTSEEEIVTDNIVFKEVLEI